MIIMITVNGLYQKSLLNILEQKSINKSMIITTPLGYRVNLTLKDKIDYYELGVIAAKQDFNFYILAALVLDCLGCLL